MGYVSTVSYAIMNVKYKKRRLNECHFITCNAVARTCSFLFSNFHLSKERTCFINVF